ncbi:MAG: GAF domain-containing protein [Saprospiraceae bacterium]|nr:GAF domain-containing protein [Saprospiraceae bacterium]
MNHLNEAYNFYLNEIHTEVKSIHSCIYLLNKNAEFINSYAVGNLNLNPFEQKYDSDSEFIQSLGYKIYEKEDDQKFVEQNISYKNDIFTIIFYPLKSTFRVNGILCVQYKKQDFNNAYFNSKKENIINKIDLLNKCTLTLKSNNKLNFLVKIFDEVWLENDKKKVFEIITKTLVTDGTVFSGSIVHLYDEFKNNLYGFVSYGIKEKLDSSRVEIGQDQIGVVYEKQEKIISLLKDHRKPYSDWALRNGYKSMLTYILKGREGNAFGTLSLFTKFNYIQEENEDFLIESFLRQISYIFTSLQEKNNNFHLSKFNQIIGESINTEISSEVLIKSYLKYLVNIFDADLAHISIFNKSNDKIIPNYFINRDSESKEVALSIDMNLSYENSICSLVVKNKECYIYPSNPNIDKYFKDYDNNENKILSELFIPLIFEDIVFGLIVISCYEAHKFTRNDMVFYQSISNNISPLIHSKIFLSLSAIINNQVFSTNDIFSLSNQTSLFVTKILNAPVCCVWLIDDEYQTDENENENKKNEVLRLTGSFGCEFTNETDKQIFDYEGGISWDLINKFRSIQSNNYLIEESNILNNESRYIHKDFAIKNSLKSMVSVPIARDNKIYGVINVYSKREIKYYTYEKTLLHSIALRIAAKIEISKLNSKYSDIVERYSKANIIGSAGVAALNFVHDINHLIHFIESDIFNLETSIAAPTKENKTLIQDSLKSINLHLDSVSSIFDILLRVGNPNKSKKFTQKIRPIIDDIQLLFRRKLEESKITMKVDCDENLKIYCGRHELEQVFLNLMLNSISNLSKLTHKPFKEINIKVSSDDNNTENVIIVFYDNGSGIPEWNYNRIFEKYFSTNQGTGLGLATCRRIIEEHNGTIYVNSKFGKETNFIIILPKNKSNSNQ